MNDLLGDLPSDAIVSINDEYYISQLPPDFTHQLSWVKVDPSHVEEMIVLTKLRMMGPMLLDTSRNDAYEAAIKNAIRPGDVVLDAGTGTGLLAMICARHGASKVYACEMNETLAHVAERIVSENGLKETIKVLPFRTDQVSASNDDSDSSNQQVIPEKADVIVCELMDSVLTTEGILDTLDDAMRRLGKPNAKVIPSRGTIYGRLVDLNGKLKEVWDACAAESISNIETEPLLVQSSCSKVQECLEFISNEVILSELEFGCVDRDLNEIMQGDSFIRCNKSGCARALLVWWKVDLDNQNSTIFNGGENSSWQDHWHQALYFMPDTGSIARNVNDTVEIKVAINPKTGRLSVLEKRNCSTEEQTSKRSRTDVEQVTMKTVWMESMWRPYLKDEFEALSKNQQKTLFVSLVDFSWSQFGKELAGETKDLKLTSTASPFNSTIVVNHADSGIKNLNEMDEAILMLFRCSKMSQPPMCTIPERALVKSIAIQLKQLEDPRPKLTQVKGFKHKEMFTNFTGGRAWSFPLELFNYEYDIACTNVVIVATMDFAKSELQISGENAKIHCDKSSANAVVFWVEWSFSSDGSSLELASPFNPYPMASCMTQFVQAERNKTINISGDLDQTTNRLVFTCSNVDE